MSLRPFTVLAHSLRKKGDLDLCPVRIHPLPRSCRFAFRVVAREQALIQCAGRQRCEGLPGRFTHSSPVHANRKTRENGQFRRAGCESYAPFRRLQRSVPVKRHLSRIFPCLTRSLAQCLSRALRQLRGSASHFVRPAGFGFQKIFSAKLRTECGRKDFPNLPKKRRLALGAGHLPSLRARVSRVRTGQIQTGEKQWHSTLTPSQSKVF